uniref:Uncharacterized protein n=1 Tax=Cannabis sativa TaxID=3483 RepID=A0A803QZN8_CANSA
MATYVDQVSVLSLIVLFDATTTVMVRRLEAVFSHESEVSQQCTYQPWGLGFWEAGSISFLCWKRNLL